MAHRTVLVVSRKAEASFAHSKRFAHHDIAVHAAASMFEGATEPRGSVWSARSLLPLWRVGRQRCSLRDSFRPLKKKMIPAIFAFVGQPPRLERISMKHLYVLPLLLLTIATSSVAAE